MPPQIVEGDSVHQAISLAVGSHPFHSKSKDGQVIPPFIEGIVSRTVMRLWTCPWPISVLA